MPSTKEGRMPFMNSHVNTAALRKAIKDFSFHSMPSSGNRSAPCTVGDIRKVVDNTAKLMTAFVDELESSM